MTFYTVNGGETGTAYYGITRRIFNGFSLKKNTSIKMSFFGEDDGIFVSSSLFRCLAEVFAARRRVYIQLLRNIIHRRYNMPFLDSYEPCAVSNTLLRWAK